MGSYSTKQQKLLLSYLSSLDGRHVSALDIADYFRGRGEKIGITTIYRHLDRLITAGRVRRYITEVGKPACFLYIPEDGCFEEEHFHLRCSSCGELIHLVCSYTSGLAGHVLEAHGFMIEPTQTVFYGKCRNCM